MNLLIVGATGGTGLHLVAQALQRGHRVAALVRDSARLNLHRSKVTHGSKLVSRLQLHAAFDMAIEKIPNRRMHVQFHLRSRQTVLGTRVGHQFELHTAVLQLRHDAR
jgi:putative NADH-flavin reductase